MEIDRIPHRWHVGLLERHGEGRDTQRARFEREVKVLIMRVVGV